MSGYGPESEFTSSPLFLSTLGVKVEPQFGKKVKAIRLKAGNIQKEIPRGSSTGGNNHERFDPPLEMPLHTQILVSIHYRRMAVLSSVVSISLDPRTVLSEANAEDGKQVYRKTEKNIEVAVSIQSLPSTTSGFLASCSRFRVLIMGKSGVGKSSLINKVFRVSGVEGSNTEPGKAEINDEYVAHDNGLFIVHDSCGFEAGDQGHLDTVCSFIKKRRHMENLKDQVHAVWLCLEIPFAGGRVLETGVEEFLKQRDQILGNTPLVVVFTKLDSLVNMLSTQALQANQFLEGDALEERKRQELEKHCLKPIQTLLKSNDVPSVAVSTEEGYEGSLSELVEKTTTTIEKHIRNEVTHYVATMAQRVNMALKVSATIAVGEKRYWNMLKESPNFKGLTMKACLDVLHKDIVTVWNFKDPQNSLYEETFKDGLLKTSDLYEASQDIVRQLMAYIVDLTCVMQILFLRITVRNGEASAEAVSIAMQAYKETNLRRVHDEISKFSVGLVMAPGRRDEVLDKIKELIHKYRIQDGDIPKFRHWL